MPLNNRTVWYLVSRDATLHVNVKTGVLGVGAQVLGAGELQPVDKTMVGQVVPLQPTGNHRGAEIHTAAHRGLHATVVRCALKEAAACQGPVPEQAPGRSCGPCGRPTLVQSVPEGLYHAGQAHIGEVNERLYPMGGTS